MKQSICFFLKHSDKKYFCIQSNKVSEMSNWIGWDMLYTWGLSYSHAKLGTCQEQYNCIDMHCHFDIQVYIIQIYSGITCGRVLNGELNAQKIAEVNLSVFVYRLFYEDFSPIIGTNFVPTVGEKCSWNSLQTNTDKLTSVNFEHPASGIFMHWSFYSDQIIMFVIVI